MIGDISVEAANGSLEVTGTLATDCIVEYSDGAGTPCLGEAVTKSSAGSSWYSSNLDSVPMDDCAASGMITLQPGCNSLRLCANAPDGARMRFVCGVQAKTPMITR